MKTKIIRTVPVLLALATFNLELSTAHAQGTAFTYQGRLNDAGNPATGVYDLRFAIYDSSSGGNFVAGPLTNSATAVTNGLFTATLDFGTGVFTGPARWVEIGVRTNGGGAFAVLNPRQPLTPSPYALYAPNAGSAASAAMAVTAANVGAGAVGNAGLQAGAVDGSKIAAAAVDTAQLSSTVLSNTFWVLSGNSGTTPGTQFVGTIDNQPLELRVQGRRAFRLEPATNATRDFGFSPNVIGGYEGNSVADGVVGATIAGGGREGYIHQITAPHGTIGGGDHNTVNGEDGTIAGGGGNVVSGDYSFIGGGLFNTLGSNAPINTIAGGQNNQIDTDTSASAIGGGYYNTIQLGVNSGTIAGGEWNSVGTNADSSAIGGGHFNQIGADAPYATIAGGNGNISGAYSATVGGGYANTAGGEFDAVGGGYYNNTASSQMAAVGGGYGNYAVNVCSTIGGGSVNTASGYCATVSGGGYNAAVNGYATVGGGYYNQASGLAATVTGGYYNSATNNYATVPGGYNNVADGQYSFAAGHYGIAFHDGTFVWADSSEEFFFSTGSNQFLIRAGGGVGIGTNNPQSALHVAGTVTATGFAGNGAALVGLNASQITTGAVPSGGLAGAYSNALALSNAANVFAGDGSGLTGLNANNLTTGTVPDTRLAGNVARTNQVWLLNGNSGTSAGAQFLGTTDNQPLELRVNSARGLRLEPAGSNSVNIIGGWSGNGAAAGVVGATIGGGGAGNYNGAGYTNRVEASFGTVSGGAVNTVQSNAYNATIGGGYGNTIQTNAYYGTIGGGTGNTIQTNSPYATISGGYGNTIQPSALYANINGGSGNTVQVGSSGSTIGGGAFNNIQPNTTSATISGGIGNTIQTNAFSSIISGGYYNTIQTNAQFATIGGGYTNTIQTNAFSSIVSGGYNNTIQAYANYASISGGYNNTIQASASYTTIPGGFENIAGGLCSFAAGYYAQATNAGSFVWADSSTSSRFSSTTNNQFNIRSANGVRIATTSAGTVGVQLAAGTTAWTTLSDRNAKKNFRPVDTMAVLEKLAAMPVTQWNYNWEQDGDVPNIGPVAQDFKAAFYPGRDDRGISTLEFDGVELAAIQGLNQKVDELKSALERRAAENAELKARIEKLEHLWNGKTESGN